MPKRERCSRRSLFVSFILFWMGLRDDSDDDSDDGVPMFLREDDAIDSAVRRNYDYVPELGNRKVPPRGKFMPLGDD